MDEEVRIGRMALLVNELETLGAQIEVDDYGQFIIYTNLKRLDDGTIVDVSTFTG